MEARLITEEAEKVKIIYRFSVNTYPHTMYYYMAMEIKDDNGVEMIFHTLETTVGYKAAELYIEIDPCPTYAQEHCRSSQTRALAHGTTSKSRENKSVTPCTPVADANYGVYTINEDVDDTQQTFSTLKMCIGVLQLVQQLIEDENDPPPINKGYTVDGDDDEDEDEDEDEYGIDEDIVHDTEEDMMEDLRAVHQPPSSIFTQNTWANVDDPSPQFGLEESTVWDHTQELRKGLCFKSKDEASFAVERSILYRNETYKVAKSNTKVWVAKSPYENCNWTV